MTPDEMLGAGFVAALIASAGLWWFRLVLKAWLLGLDRSFRFGLYALVWLAYFVIVAALAHGASDAPPAATPASETPS